MRLLNKLGLVLVIITAASMPDIESEAVSRLALVVLALGIIMFFWKDD